MIPIEPSLAAFRAALCAKPNSLRDLDAFRKAATTLYLRVFHAWRKGEYQRLAGNPVFPPVKLKALEHSHCDLATICHHAATGYISRPHSRKVLNRLYDGLIFFASRHEEEDFDQDEIMALHRQLGDNAHYKCVVSYDCEKHYLTSPVQDQNAFRLAIRAAFGTDPQTDFYALLRRNKDGSPIFYHWASYPPSGIYEKGVPEWPAKT